MHLNIEEHVLREFEFLISKFHFRCVETDRNCVRFESETVFVNVRFDSERSFEIDIEIGQKGLLYNGKERPFYMGEILRLNKSEEKEKFTFLQASDNAQLEHAVRRLSVLLQKYGVDLLKSDSEVFNALVELRERECREYATTKELKQIRTEVEQAWRKKDFAEIVKLYSPVRALLSNSEERKLDYAIKHCKQKVN